jgi:hypothetical protein
MSHFCTGQALQSIVRLGGGIYLCFMYLPSGFRMQHQATYALAVGQMSGVVDTDSGVHIILRTA